MRILPIKSLVVLTVIFVIMLVFFDFTSESQKNDILDSSSINSVLVIVPTFPGAIIDLFVAPASCRDQASSFPSYLNCPSLHIIDLVFSYIIYLFIIMIFWGGISKKIKYEKNYYRVESCEVCDEGGFETFFGRVWF